MAAVKDGDTILTPNTELAAALLDAVERTHVLAGLDVWPTPRVRDFGSWLRERHSQKQLSDSSIPRILGDIEERELWRQLIESTAAGQELLDPSGMMRAARRARRALFEYGIDVVAANRAAATEEWTAFLQWNRRFEERCGKLRCISADELMNHIDAPLERIVWIESPAWKPTARRWLTRHGRELRASVATAGAPRLIHAPSPAAELAAIGEWARANLLSNLHFRAWVCIPDLNRRRAEVVNALDAALLPQRFDLIDDAAAAPYAVAGGTALADYPAVRAALLILAASCEEIRFEEFSLLLRAPELQAGAAEAAAAAQLDVYLRCDGPAEADLAGWLELAERVARARHIGEVAAIQGLHRVLHTLGELWGDQFISRWVALWVRSLESGPWALRGRWSSPEYQSAERFRELLAELATADAFFGALSRPAAQRVLQRAARDTLFQPQTGVPAIAVSAQLMDPWLAYDGLWISGLSDERWPPAVAPLPLLPLGLQRDFAVVTAADDSQLHFARDLHERWATRAAHCVFSYADSTDGRAAPSPLLPADTLPLDWVEDTHPQPHWRAQFAQAPTLELLPEIAPPFGPHERTRGVSTLRAQSHCAFQGFAHTRLQLDRLERPVAGFNDRERGELIHHALEHIWTVLRNSARLHSLSPQSQAQLLKDAANRAMSTVKQSRDPGSRWRALEGERMQSVLGKWLDAERLRAPFEVEALEQGRTVARHAGLEFSVRLDRIDRLADGARVLIDYKTGIAAADWRGARPENPQLPIYALLKPDALVAVAYGRVNASECEFVAESERASIFKPHGRPTKLEGQANFAKLIGEWSQRIEKLAAEFAAGHAEVAPTTTACKKCHLHGLCRVTMSLGEEGSWLGVEVATHD